MDKIWAILLLKGKLLDLRFSTSKLLLDFNRNFIGFKSKNSRTN